LQRSIFVRLLSLLASCSSPASVSGLHTLAALTPTFLIHEANDMKTAQALLRHANATTTLGL
jgi:hypothetical protein